MSLPRERRSWHGRLVIFVLSFLSLFIWCLDRCSLRLRRGLRKCSPWFLSSVVVDAHVWDPTLGNKTSGTSKENFFLLDFAESWIWNPFQRKKGTGKLSQAASSIESELEERWHALEESIKSHAEKMEDARRNIKDSVEDLKNDLEETFETHSQKFKNKVLRTTKSLEESFVRNVLKQRHGFEKWFRTIRNHLLFVLGGMNNFSGGLTPEAASRAIIFQSGLHTWLILNMFGNANSNGSSEEADSRTSDVDTNFPKSGFRKLRHCATKVVMKLRQITRSILFKDAIAFLTAAYVAKQKIPPTCHSLLETGLPIATIVHAMVRTVRKIVRILQDQDVWKQKQQRRPHGTPLPNQPQLTNHDESASLHPKSKTAKYIVVSFTATVAGFALFFVLPGITLPMVAASASSSTLMLDCISDEVVGNWFGILRRMNRKNRINIFRGAVWGMYQQLQRKFLYPAQAALEELEASIGYGDHEPIHNETLRERVKEAVNQSMDVKLSWMLAGFGVLMQVLWMNLGLLQSSLLGNLDDNRGKKKIETIQR